ncbi:1-acyl-sn-glycerol-3-phosphate acyltransferase [Georgenia sp. TF02-10]|uniref:lysophospholipid acyltransferase family protein n=1 Tax=Georgenia sp. TF02-10 TaxID=2917725 RepID=UPI001FA80037|nr:lysophospholipid acyltransferase family protein [Georgenia sp. TF02-10]UNX53874.1 1-acyl-sn-glycerol-3-phosphate acyltransferase [Georgenia sp. TF02-10]
MASRRRSAAYRVAAVVVVGVLRLTTRRTWRGGEHLPRTGGFIAVANHVSNFDPLTVADFLNAHGAPPRFLAKDTLFDVPLLGVALRALGQIPVRRGTDRAAEALVAAEAALAAGECVVVFPEGTHTRDPGEWPMRGRTGVARLALRTGAPVVPLAQWGAQQVIPRFTATVHPFPPRPVVVVAGSPVDLSDLYGRPLDAAVLTEATARVMVAITALLAGVRGEVPPARPYDVRVDGDPRAAYDAARAARRAERAARRRAREVRRRERVARRRAREARRRAWGARRRA